jgi:hypothetical protein
MVHYTIHTIMLYTHMYGQLHFIIIRKMYMQTCMVNNT